MKKAIAVYIKGGLGDAIICTSPILALREKFKDQKIHLFCKTDMHKQVYLRNPGIDRVWGASWFTLTVLQLCIDLRLATLYKPDYYPPFYPPFISKTVAETASELIGVLPGEDRAQIFLTEKEDKKAIRALSAYKNPIAMNITSRTTENQEWEFPKWEELVRQMPDYTFIQLGSSDEPEVAGAVDWRGKTNFRDALAVVKHCRSFVGIPSSLSHATNAFDIPGVVLFGPASPDVWGHANNINLVKQLRCSPCIDQIFKSPCPYERACMKSITVEEVRQALLTQLSRN
ncbi:MAG TPA: glycosyltransferase family 9 protein [Puia sp.]|nr:glycosyltransferase family 9 protein [Puia sp.]